MLSIVFVGTASDNSVGEILGGGIAFLLFQSSVTVAIAGSIFFISYLSGCMFALWRMGRTSVINALFSME